MQFGLDQNDPAARAAAADAERIPEFSRYTGFYARMPRRRSWLRVQLAEQDLSRDVLGQALDVFVIGEADDRVQS